MIKIFRHIRQRLLEQNRFSKYLLYAMGEIVLVVIGILIALQVNTWNTNRQSTIKELSLLAEMRENLKKDVIDSKYNKELNERFHESNKIILQQLDARHPFHDSMRLHYGSIWGATVQTMNTSAFDNLNSIGFDLIKNDALRRSITALYSERYPFIKRVESDFDNKIQMNEVLPQINAKIIVDTMWQSGYPININMLMDDDEFKGILRNNVFTKKFMAGRYGAFEERLRSLLEQIEDELDRRQL